MALITLKILVIIYLTMSIMTDFSAYATCTETDNCGSDSGGGGGGVGVVAGAGVWAVGGCELSVAMSGAGLIVA